MVEYNYTEISVETVIALRSLIKDVKLNPRLLDSSPYDEVTKQTLKQLLIKGDSDSQTERTNTKLEDLDYEAETISLYESINEIDALDIDPKERISVIKLKTSILQDLLNMMKESKRIKEINKFEEMVFSILTEDQKNKILEG